jgi:hypothetical protein
MLDIGEVSDFFAFQVDLLFDPTTLAATGISEGPSCPGEANFLSP